jgi:hypothetical protein
MLAAGFWQSLLISCLLLLAACGNDAADRRSEYTGPLMRPGQDCSSCHSENSGRGAPVWSAAGTVFSTAESPTDAGVSGARVILSEPDGSELETLTTNQVGNFYTARALPKGFRVAIEYEGERLEMPCSPPGGLCNACHTLPPIGFAPGRIFIPQSKDPNRPDFDCTAWQPRPR